MSEAADNELPQERSEYDANLRQSRIVRHASVYDAVAGRISTGGFRRLYPSVRKSNVHSSSTKIAPAVAPEEALFRRLNAPTRYMENDIYFANDKLPEDQPLPDSDLLKAIHTYTSDFYKYSTPDQGTCAWRSMDETALIAMGFLLEEMASEALEETGDMVFVEGEEVTDAETGPSSRRASFSSARSRSVKRAASSGLGRPDRREDDDLIRFRSEQRRKRRRVASVSIKHSDSEGPP